MFEFMYQQIAAQQRPVGFYPETSYWVNYDTEVPLFLPVYAYQRLRDLRGIAREEVRGHANGCPARTHTWQILTVRLVRF